MAHQSGIVMDDLDNEVPECGVLFRLINQNNFSAIQAVEDIVFLTKAAAEALHTINEDAELYTINPLLAHAETVGVTIAELAQCLPHDRQSKLIDFIGLLCRHTVSDFYGNILEIENEHFWADMPRMVSGLSNKLLSADQDDMDTIDREDPNPAFENISAFVAQLIEIGYIAYPNTDWSLCLTRIFEDGFAEDGVAEDGYVEDRPDIGRRDVRLVCIWLIYAPTKIWRDCQLRTRSARVASHQFEPGLCLKWRQFLESRQFSLNFDDNTQDLINRALDKLDWMEANNTSLTNGAGGAVHSSANHRPHINGF